MLFMDIIIVYLYGSIDNDIYILNDLNFLIKENNTKLRSMCSIKLR